MWSGSNTPEKNGIGLSVDPVQEPMAGIPAIGLSYSIFLDIIQNRDLSVH